MSCDVGKVTEELENEQRLLRLNGHIARMELSRIAHRILVRKPEGKRDLGIPRRRW